VASDDVVVLGHPGDLLTGFLRPALLLLIKEQRSHGYDLANRLPALGITAQGHGLYRTLRTLEQQGAISSEWEFPSPGPARCVYRLTPVGDCMLAALVAQIGAACRSLSGYMDRYAAACGEQRDEERR
jgi:DNA-binding PadR family transcriptional regulator